MGSRKPIFQYHVDYNVDNELVNVYTWKYDMDYLRHKIMTHRSITNVTDTTISRYYEAAKTLVDCLDVTDKAISFADLVSIDINIRPFTRWATSVLTATYLYRHNLESDSIYNFEMKINYIYIGRNKQCGLYMVELVAEKPYYIRKTIGVTTITEAYSRISKEAPYIRDNNDMCFQAGATLRYSENLPIPSVFYHMIHKAADEVIDTMIHYVDHPEDVPIITPDLSNDEIDDEENVDDDE